MHNNIYKNLTHLNDLNKGASFVNPMKDGKSRGDGFYKYSKYKLKNSG